MRRLFGFLILVASGVIVFTSFGGGAGGGVPFSGAVTERVTHLAGPLGGPGNSDGARAAARFNSPYGITTDGKNLYVADSNNSTIRKIVIATGAVTTLAGATGRGGATDGTGAAARFNHPFGITTDGTNIYVADSFNHTIRRIVIATGAVTTLAGTAGSAGSVDGPGETTRFNSLYGMTNDGTTLLSRGYH